MCEAKAIRVAVEPFCPYYPEYPSALIFAYLTWYLNLKTRLVVVQSGIEYGYANAIVIGAGITCLLCRPVEVMDIPIVPPSIALLSDVLATNIRFSLFISSLACS